MFYPPIFLGAPQEDKDLGYDIYDNVKLLARDLDRC